VKRLDYEGELAVVMGAGGEIAGYAVADDVSARDLQRREPQWTRAKGADGFCPWGPWVTTADEVPDPEDLGLRTWVNGELRQDARTSDLIFGPRAERRWHVDGAAPVFGGWRRGACGDRAARRDRARDR